jgi:hypothetical protein
MPQLAVDLLLLDLKVGDRRVQLGVPVHQALVAVDQAVLVEVDEDLAHGEG